MQNKKLRGTISVDTDSLDMFYSAINNNILNEHDLTYRIILPRYLDFLKENNIRATFFIIGSHIKSQYHQSILKRMVNEGHEVGNHTFNHHLHFSSLPLKIKEQEIRRCETIIEEVTGIRPVGFRAPAYSIDSETIKILEKRDYLYDSSIYPSFFNILSSLYHFIKTANLKNIRIATDIKHMLSPIKPYHPDLDKIYIKGSSRIFELPINSVPVFRLPFHGTFLFASGSRCLFNFSLKMIFSFNVPLNYLLHSVDLYDRDNDSHDTRLDGLAHPSIKKSYKIKLEFYEYLFRKFNELYTISPIKDLISGI